METDSAVEVENQQDVLLPDTTIITHCIFKNELERLLKSFDDDTDPYKETIMELINERDQEGKTPLDLAACYGRVDICRELLKRGADLTAVTEKGYCPLHHAAVWGRIGILKVLVEHHANLQQRNAHGERARETAARYNQTECVDFLDWAEAKVNLMDTIKMCIESVTDPEKAPGKVAKDEKNLVMSSCKGKNDWLETNQDPTTQDLILQRISLEELIAPILRRVSENPPDKK